MYAVVRVEWWRLDVQVLASSSLTRFMRTLKLNCGLGGIILREVAFQSLKGLLCMWSGRREGIKGRQQFERT
jgi:hypothetical protein